jgi:hypothetical protein
MLPDPFVQATFDLSSQLTETRERDLMGPIYKGQSCIINLSLSRKGVGKYSGLFQGHEKFRLSWHLNLPWRAPAGAGILMRYPVWLIGLV